MPADTFEEIPYCPQELPHLQVLTYGRLDGQAAVGTTDCTLLIYHDANLLASQLASSEGLASQLKCLGDYLQADPGAAAGAKEAPLIIVPGGRKLISSSTGPLLRDHDDVRRYGEATARAIKRAKSLAGVKRALLILQAPPYEEMEESVATDYRQYYEVAMLAALAEIYEPLEARETLPDLKQRLITDLQVVLIDPEVEKASSGILDASRQTVEAIEAGRRLAKDIGGSDPERMTAIRAAQIIRDFFSTKQFPEVKLWIEDQPEVLQREYPLLAAVARASAPVSRHAPRVVHLEYRSPDAGAVQEDLYMVGKGINYDTGGADLKVGGAMGGMSRDKCGAAALAGLMATCVLLRPRHLNLTISLAFVRNSIGSNSYVADEIIRSRAGIRVRIGNTDAEGRMVMSDLLARHRETALQSGQVGRARLFTCATLTGHVVRAYGPYAAALENGPARLLGMGRRLQQAGQRIGDCFEVSTVRREDFDFVAPLSNCEDVLQANKAPSTLTNRGHQYPAAFLMIASGLDKHGLDAPKEQRLAYTHLDIAGVAEEGGFLGKATGSPVAALTMALLKN